MVGACQGGCFPRKGSGEGSATITPEANMLMRSIVARSSSLAWVSFLSMYEVSAGSCFRIDSACDIDWRLSVIRLTSIRPWARSDDFALVRM